MVSRVLVRNIRESLSGVVNENVLSIDSQLNKVELQARSLSKVQASQFGSEQQTREFLAFLFRENPDLVSAVITRFARNATDFQATQYVTNRSSTMSSIPLDYRDIETEPWFQIPYFIQSEHWSEPWYDALGTKTLICSYSYPVMKEGALIGIVRLDTNIQRLRRFRLPVQLQEGGYAFLVSSHGTIISHPADSLVMNYTIFNLAEEFTDNHLRKIGKNMISGGTEFVQFQESSYFANKWLYYAPLSSNKWSLAIVVGNREVFADLKSLLIMYIVISVVTFIVTMLITYSRIVTIHKPLRGLTDATKQIGSGEFDTPLPQVGSVYEIEKLTESFEAMRTSLKEYISNLNIVTSEKNKISSEVAFAAEVQRSLIPQNDSQPTEKGELLAYGILEPAGDVGGDLYEYFMIDERHFCFAVADVLGKGLPAAMTMTMVTTLLRSVAPHHKDPAIILQTLNSFLTKNNLESNFITILFGVIDLATGKLCFSNCGHVPMYLRRSDREIIKFEDTHATALGVFETITIESQCVELEPGDELILFTDGITEAMGTDESYFGTAGLEKVLNALQNPKPKTTASAILSEVKRFADPTRNRDDITILVIEFAHPQR
jgi:sigma-B regulation protein RsbU (phosphoserine phosphatase)